MKNKILSKLKKYKKILFIIIFAIITAGSLFFLLFNKKTEAAWWNDQWLYRKALVINQTYVTADLTDFPVLVSHTDATYATKIQTDADDIVFTDNLGNKLSHEIESYNSGTGALVAWVKIPALDGDNNSTIYMYYGNASVASQEDATNVWDENFVMVQHLEEGGTGTRYDSTNYGNDADTVGYDSGSATVNGKINGTDNFDGAADYLLADDADSIDFGTADFTASFWIKVPDVADIAQIMAKVDDPYYIDSGNPGWTVVVRDLGSGGKIRFQVLDSNNNNYDLGGGTTIDNDQWYYVAVIKTNNLTSIYLNGSVDASYGSVTYNGSVNNGHSFRINDSYNDFDGTLDEVRASASARSADWILTEYNNQNSPATFFSVQTEEKSPGPIGYWSFDEGQGTTAEDGSGQGNDGNITGGANWKTDSECLSGKCLQYDGAGNYVVVTDDDNLYDGASDFTVGIWARYPGAVNGWDVLIAKESWTANTGYTLVLTDTNNLIFYTNSQSRKSIANPFTDNKWHYVSVSISSGNGILYIDGKAQGGSFSAPITGNAVNMFIGARHQNDGTSFTDPFKGFIDEVKVYPYARTAEQVKQDYNAGLAGQSTPKGASAAFGSKSDKWMSEGLVGYWKMDETAGAWDSDTTADDAIDFSGNGNTCSAYGSADAVSSGKFGNTGDFNGGTDRLDCGAVAYSADQFTYAAWVKLDTLSPTEAYAGIITRYYSDDNNRPPYLEFSNPDNQFRYIHRTGGSWVGMNFGTETTTGNWVHLVFTYDHGNIRAFRNGELANTYDGVIAPPASAGNIYIGRTTSESFDGDIDEVRIYNRALTPSEVEGLYNFAPGPVGHWKMDDSVSGNGQTIVDTSSNGNNGTTNDGANDTGMDCAVPGKYGTACNFDGTDDYVSLPNNAFSSLSSGTISAWIKLNNLTSNYSIWTTKVGTDTWNYLGLYWGSADGFIFYIKNSSSALFQQQSGTSGFSAGTWYHIVVTVGTEGNKMFINGQQRSLTYSFGNSSTQAFFSSLTSSTQLNFIGAEYYNGSYAQYFPGLIDDVQIYNYALSSKQVVNVMNGRNPGDAAVGSPVGSTALHLPFDEGYGDTAYDKSINGNDGTLTPGSSGGNTTVSAMWDNGGKFGKAMEFDGTDDFVNLSSPSTLDNIPVKTITAWIKTTDLSGTVSRRVVDKEDGDAGWFFGTYGTNDNLIYANHFTISTPGDNWKNWQTPSSSIVANQWYFIAVVYDRTSASNDPTIYINGVSQALTEVGTDSGTAVDDSSRNIGIGGEVTATGNFFPGLIDDVKIYPFALTADEVKTDFNKGAAATIGYDVSRSNNGTAVTGAAKDYCIPGDTSPCSAPVGEWKMDEYSGTTTYDTSGNGNNGTLGGGTAQYYPTWTEAGKKGSALNFDGTDDYVQLSNIQSNTQTISAWIKPYVYAAGNPDYNHAILAKGTDTANGFFSLNLTNDGTVQAKARSSSSGMVYAYAGVAPLNQWTFVTAVIDGPNNRITVYQDGGKYIGTNSIVSFTSNTNVWDIGRNNNFAPYFYHFDGLIDDVRVFNYARTPAQIAWDFNRGKPVAEWKFDECQGNTVYDYSGNAYNGTITIGGTGTQDALGVCSAGDSGDAWYNGRTGKNNSSLSFDGTDDWIDAGAQKIGNADTWAISAWFKTDETVNELNIYSEGNSASLNNILMLMVNDDDGPDTYIHGSIRKADGTWLNCEGAVDSSDGNWHHVVFLQVSDTNRKIYLDGNLVGTDTADAGTLTMNLSTIGAGRRNGTTWNYFDGQIDDVKIFNFALTPLQIKDLYNGGSASFR